LYIYQRNASDGGIFIPRAGSVKFFGRCLESVAAVLPRHRDAPAKLKLWRHRFWGRSGKKVFPVNANFVCTTARVS